MGLENSVCGIGSTAETRVSQEEVSGLAATSENVKGTHTEPAALARN